MATYWMRSVTLTGVDLQGVTRELFPHAGNLAATGPLFLARYEASYCRSTVLETDFVRDELL